MTHFENVVKMCSVAEVTFKNLLHPEWSRCGSASNFKNIFYQHTKTNILYLFDNLLF